MACLFRSLSIYAGSEIIEYRFDLYFSQNFSQPPSKAFLQLYVDEVAKVGGITSRHASSADDDAPPSPITMETDTPVIDTQFTSPQPMPSAGNLTASPMISRTSPQAPSSVNVPSPFAASPNVNSPGTMYGVGSPGEILFVFVCLY